MASAQQGQTKHWPLPWHFVIVFACTFCCNPSQQKPCSTPAKPCSLGRQASAGKVCRCGAQRKNCHLGISVTALKAVRTCFWSVAADVRAYLLRSLHEAAQSEQKGSLGLVSESSASSSDAGSEADAGRRPKGPPLEWHLCGQRVCFANFAHLLSTTQRTILKSIRSEPDHRRLRGPIAASGQKLTCYFFFYELYQSARTPVLQMRVHTYSAMCVAVAALQLQSDLQS